MTNASHRFGRAWRERLTVLRPTRPAPSPANPPLPFRAVERVLALFVAGLTDGALVVIERHGNAPGEAYTDGRTIFLPERIDRYPDRAGNLRLYKTLIAHAAAQVFYGTLAHDGGIERLRAAPEPDLALELFGIVEGARLAARLGADFPGIGRDLARLASEGLAERPDVAALAHRPQLLEALVRHTLGHDPRAAVAARHRERLNGLLAIAPSEASAPAGTRADSVDRALALASLLADVRPGPRVPPVVGRSVIRLDRAQVEAPTAPERAETREPARLPPSGAPPTRGPTLVVEGQGPPPALPNEERRADPGGARQVAVSYADTLPQFTARLVPLTPEERRGAFVYPEWDATIKGYRPDWCALRPRRVGAAGTDYVERVLRRHHARVQALKRQFETLRPERLRLRRQDDGEDLDLDVVVESHVDRKLGLPPGERPYARVREQRRDIAVAFLIDLSGSTGGYVAGPRGGERVIDVAKQALVMLCEALSVLDDRYAVYGFSGSTRKGCEFYTVKDFADGYDDEVKRRLGGLLPLSYTRLGAPLRHTTQLLQGIAARVKLLMLLSDGRPNDFDAYGGEYGIEDTRRALLEARGRGIRTFCLTIDAESRDYLPRLFGANDYVTLSQVAALPRKLPDLYRRLTAG